MDKKKYKQFCETMNQFVDEVRELTSRRQNGLTFEDAKQFDIRSVYQTWEAEDDGETPVWARELDGKEEYDA